MANQLACTIHCSTPISAIQYNAPTKKYIIDHNGSQSIVHHLILATNAYEAQKLLALIPDTQNFADSLEHYRLFFKTTVAIHGDRRFMPKNGADWSVANIRYDGTNSALTICKPLMKEIPIFRSWITFAIGVPESNAMPQPLYDLKHFYHPKVNQDYFNAQKAIAKLQGIDNCWIAGFYTQDVDSHNSAILSAINIAKKLAPTSERLLALTS